MRDFYIYGFKARDDFSLKSARTYDNEKRRCESYLGENFKWAYAGGSKVSFVSADCGKIPANPLFAAWKSKSFTGNDIMLHFYILDALQTGDKSADELTDEISAKSGNFFDLQTVRGKCAEYAGLGILTKEKNGKAFRYSLSKNTVNLDDEILDAVKFFQSGALGIIGDYILDNTGCENDLFVFKHHYIAHTLEDGILFDILDALREHKEIEAVLVGAKSGKPVKNRVVPAKILCSFWSGRRYLCAYLPASRRFSTYRLDAIKSVAALEPVENYMEIQESLSRNIGRVWGVSFDGDSRNERGFSMTLRIDENREKHIISRINKEGRGGAFERVGDNTFKFSKDIFDANEAMPWVKTFIGRLISFESTDRLEKKLAADIRRMAEMYGIREEAGDE
ncbi:MAG: WYL domain-containing protein [Clostridiales bacterium]|nr:WYL domain-containing protein [Clostridiales bacterium]